MRSCIFYMSSFHTFSVFFDEQNLILERKVSFKIFFLSGFVKPFNQEKPNFVRGTTFLLSFFRAKLTNKPELRGENLTSSLLLWKKKPNNYLNQKSSLFTRSHDTCDSCLFNQENYKQSENKRSKNYKLTIHCLTNKEDQNLQISFLERFNTL